MGLEVCLSALRKMHVAWPTALRSFELLEGACLAPAPDTARLLRISIPGNADHTAYPRRKRGLDRLEEEDLRTYLPSLTSAPPTTTSFTPDYLSSNRGYERISMSQAYARPELDTSFISSNAPLLSENTAHRDTATFYAQPDTFERWLEDDASTSATLQPGPPSNPYLERYGSKRITPPSLSTQYAPFQYEEPEVPRIGINTPLVDVHARFPQYFAENGVAQPSYAQHDQAYRSLQPNQSLSQEQYRPQFVSHDDHHPQVIGSGPSYMFLNHGPQNVPYSAYVCA
jgi:hypothetical protein